MPELRLSQRAAPGSCRAGWRGRERAHRLWLDGKNLQQLAAPHERTHECGPAGLIHPVHGKLVLGEVDPQKGNGHGHRLSSGEHMRFRNPIVSLQFPARLGSFRSAPSRDGDVPFIR